MKYLSIVLVACVALIPIVSTEDEDPSKELLKKELLQESLVLLDKDNSDSQVSALKYITCGGTTWSCEDCNTRKLCLEFWWSTHVAYYQCPVWAPYCTSTSSIVSCSNTGPAGCTGDTTTSASTSG